MAQDIGELLQCGASAPHPHGSGVAEYVCAGEAVGQSTAAESPADSTSNELCGNGGVERCMVADEQVPGGTRGSCAVHVPYDRLSGWHRQRQHIYPSRLPMADGECAFSPVQILKLNSGYLASTQPHVQQAARHGVVASPACAALVKRSEKSGYFLGCPVYGYCIQAPLGSARNGGQHRLNSVPAAHRAETQVAAQSSAEDVQCTWPVVILGPDHELHDIGRPDLVDVYWSGAETIRQNLPNHCLREVRVAGANPQTVSR